MPEYRNRLVKLIWHECEPFSTDHGPAAPTDFQGWASDNPFLERAITEVQPRLVVEIGVWKGGSVITLANAIRLAGLDSAVIAIDTWAGSSEHWLNTAWFSSLGIRDGQPTLYKTFASNIRARGLNDYVVPLPVDSLNGAAIVKAHGLPIDVLHLDGGHDFESVSADLRVWWPLLRPGGVLIGDDYHPNGELWPDVQRAFHGFFKVDHIDNFLGKCYIKKVQN